MGESKLALQLSEQLSIASTADYADSLNLLYTVCAKR